MEKSNEINMVPHSSTQLLGSTERAPSLMYLIELDPNISTCLTGDSLPLQMLNVNQNNTHYLIPIEGTVPLEIEQYKHHQHLGKTQPILPIVSSRDVRDETLNHHHHVVQTISGGGDSFISGDVRDETLNTIVTNREPQSFHPKANSLGVYADTNTRPTSNGQGEKSHINYNEEIDEQCQTASNIHLTGTLEAQPANALGAANPAQKYVHISDAEPPPRAVLSLPRALRLHCGRVAPRKLLPPARFGPVRGLVQEITSEDARELVLKAAASSKPVFLVTKGDKLCHIDVSDQEKSNWFSLLPLGSSGSANVWLQQQGDELFAVSSRGLHPRSPLSLGYSQQYALQLRLPPAQAAQAAQREEEQRKWWCDECGSESQSAALHRRHSCSADFKPKQRRRRYRCQHCALPFARLFTLKRHVALHCKSKASAASPEPPPPVANTTAEDERVPSDESFQNYSTLDFCTTLFDADIPRPDLGLYDKDDSFLGQPGQADTAGISRPANHVSPVDYSKKNAKTSSLTKCSLCGLSISSNMKYRHKRQCGARRVACACGAAFRDLPRLQRHLRAAHAGTQAGKEDTDSSSSTYKCEQCQNTFKRRGMLVNHLWRVHGAAPRVPLQRRQRHYPCPACPKLYRTAAKRDRHVRAHHPDAELARAGCIESGAVVCEPAACPACPRQYATRAKLLQHMRQTHPLLAPPSKPKPQKQGQNESSQS